MINDPRHRTTITKLRTHSHCLQTETGNYTKGERDYKCPNCDSGAIETVTHCGNVPVVNSRESDH